MCLTDKRIATALTSHFQHYNGHIHCASLIHGLHLEYKESVKIGSNCHANPQSTTRCMELLQMKLTLKYGKRDADSQKFGHLHNVFTLPSLPNASKGPAVVMQAIDEQSDNQDWLQLAPRTSQPSTLMANELFHQMTTIGSRHLTGANQKSPMQTSPSSAPVLTLPTDDHKPVANQLTSISTATTPDAQQGTQPPVIINLPSSDESQDSTKGLLETQWLTWVQDAWTVPADDRPSWDTPLLASPQQGL